MHCGYDITGTIPNSEGQVTCPECGLVLRRSTHRVMSRADFQKHLRRSLLYPFGIWSLATILLTVPAPDSIVAALAIAAHFSCYPIALLVIFFTTWSRLHQKTAVHPRPYPRWTIPLWVMLYSAMTVAFFIFVMFIGM